MKINICSVCHQTVLSIEDNHDPITCCENEMNVFDTNETYQSDDEHTIVVRQIGSFVTLDIVDHPMIDVHKILFYLILTNQGFYYKDLREQRDAKVEFILAENEIVDKVFAYCNAHSIISADINEKS